MRYVFKGIDSIPPACIRGNWRGHWATKRAAAAVWRAKGKAYGEEVLSGRRGLTGELQLTVTYWSPRKIDGDNFLIGMKPFVDGLVDAGVMGDDDQVTVWVVRRAPLSRERRVEVEIKELEVTDDGARSTSGDSTPAAGDG